MKRTSMIFMILLCSTMAAFGTKLADLPEVVYPTALCVSGDRIYIPSLKYKVFLYSGKDYRLIRTFITKGEGPGEAASNEFDIRMRPHSLVVNNQGKVMFFSPAGDFIEETRFDSNIEDLTPLDKGFVGLKRNVDEKGKSQHWDMTLFDNDFKEIKKLRKGIEINTFTLVKGKKKNFPLYPDLLAYTVYNNKIYVQDTRRGFSITLFDFQGKFLREIRKEYPKIKIPQSHIDAIFKEREKSRNWDKIKQVFNFVYPENFPAMARTWVTDDHIYVLTYRTRKEEKETWRELIVLDLEGNEQKRLYVPPIERSGYAWISKGVFYFLHENDVNQMWELHRHEIE